MEKSVEINIENYLESINGGDPGTFTHEYIAKHAAKFKKTTEVVSGVTGGRALEIGATDFFQVYLASNARFAEVWGTVFADNPVNKRYSKHTVFGTSTFNSVYVDLDIEREFFPVTDEYFDFVMMAEVIEHLDVDPMFTLLEINRILSTNGLLFISTPNSCSARNVYKILNGYRPHFFMQYERSRSPYRHNFEHDIHSLYSLLTSAGFSIVSMDTKDVFEPEMPEIIKFLNDRGYPVEFRGDDIFILAKKIPIGLSEQPVVNRCHVDRLRARVGEGFFLFVGALRYYKGLPVLIEAAKATRLPVVIAGAGEEEALVRSAISSNVTYLGFVSDDEKWALLKLCAVFVFPSCLRSEAFGVALLEAARAGRAMISCEIGTGTTYVNLNGRTGITIQPGDAGALAAAMRELSGSPSRREWMGINARRRYEELFRAEKMADGYASLYRSLIESKINAGRGLA